MKVLEKIHEAKKELYKMDLLDQFQFRDFVFTRMPGGWLLEAIIYQDRQFIPYSDEFKPKENDKIDFSQKNISTT